MSYTPQDQNIYLAAITGAVSGMAAANRNLIRTYNVSAYSGLAEVADAFAQEIDIQYAAHIALANNQAAIEAVQSACFGYWADRSPADRSPINTATNWVEVANGIMSLVIALLTQLGISGITGSSSGIRIVWRPNGGGDATTWAEVMTLLGNIPNVEIYCDQPAATYTIPVPVPLASYDMKQAFFTAPEIVDGGLVTIDIADTASLLDLSGQNGAMQLNGNSAAVPCLFFSAAVATYKINGALECILNNAGGAPMAELTGGNSLTIELSGGAAILTVTPNPTRIANATASIIALVITENNGISAINNDIFSGDAASTLFVYNDGTLQTPPPTFAGFAGTITPKAKGMAGGSGPTAFRPVTPPHGCLYYDTDTTHVIYWDGAAWQVVV